MVQVLDKLHMNPRSEAFAAFSPGLELHWIDEQGTVQILDMAPQTKLALVIVPPYLAHAVINTSV